MTKAISRELSSKVVLIGAGPIGIEVASGLKRAGVDYLQLEKGPPASTIYSWPRHARFFSSPERVAIAGIPFSSPDQEQPTREDYLAYLRGVVEILGLEILSYYRVTGISGEKGSFVVQAESLKDTLSIRCEEIILAIGDMGEVNRLGIPGEDLPHVSHILEDPHLYFGSRLLIVGGRNSALEAALRCFRSGVRVSLSYRRREFDRERVNSRLHLELSILTGKGIIPFYPETVPSKITEEGVELAGSGGDGKIFIPSDFVLLATGYHADLSLFKDLGIPMDGEGVPLYSKETMECAVEGVFLAGTAVSGARQRYKDFIGTSHHHAARIVKALSGMDVPVGTIASRCYSFSTGDIEAD
ncbi:NAD(P)-binding domain-containing protein [Marispirochaeta sp.]|uniref:NAD(P)-binding domain-containing protein n=1 Tax=Marispirochaeta sp. TaxID=2038653 RepID=UPI0029C8AB90|nr:NAD(P)-binding domain-containing protein [Marispirochaeta sp.]